jgi:hypothetical protein
MAHLDHAYLKDIISLIGAEQFAGLREQFVRDCEQAIAVLEAAATKGDEAPVVRQAHWLKVSMVRARRSVWRKACRIICRRTGPRACAS